MAIPGPGGMAVPTAVSDLSAGRSAFLVSGGGAPPPAVDPWGAPSAAGLGKPPAHPSTRLV